MRNKSKLFDTFFVFSDTSDMVCRATTGLQKCGPGWVGPLKNSGPRAKFWAGLWPDPALSSTHI